MRVLDSLTRVPGIFPASLRFHPGKPFISYGAVRDGVANVFEQPVEGGAERQLTSFGRDGAARLFFGAWSRDGRLALSLGTQTSDVVLISSQAGR